MATTITRFRDIPEFIRSGSYEVDCDPVYLLEKIDEFVQNDGLDLDPEFQRGHVWTEQQQVAFIEFFLKGGSTGRVIYLNYPSWHHAVKAGCYNDFVIVDGKQRLRALERFVKNEFMVFGSYYKEFTDKIRMRNMMKLNINDLKSKREVLQWYLDFNSGGTVHSEAELEKVRKLIQKENK